MVQIAIKLSSQYADSKEKEWAIIELQGDLEARSPVPLSGKFIGDLHFTHKDAPVLIIGHHILHGKVINMEKPLALIVKDTENADNADDIMDTSESGISSEAGKKETQYLVQAVIRKKILFKTRPKPIIAHVPKKL